MIYYKTEAEIELIRESCLLVSKTLALVGEMLRPGISGLEIDKKAEEFIRDHKAIPGFKGYQDFPATLCVSPNEYVVHGIPTKREFQDGEIVSVDCGVILNGFYGDAAYTFAVGDVKEAVMDLCRATKTSLYIGIENAKVGNRIGDIGFAIQSYIQNTHNYSVVRELVGHGVGRDLHEEPQVPNYGKRGRGVKIEEGLVIAIEPMVNLGKKQIATVEDGWGVIAKDKKPAAHYEHSIAVKSEGPDILSDHSFLEAAISKNTNLKAVDVLELV